MTDDPPRTDARPSGEQYDLVHNTQRATIVEVGGGVRTYTVGERAVIDGYSADQPCPSSRGQLLLPWPNRVRDGRYTFAGEVHQLELTEPARHNASHGLVRKARWVPAARADDRVVLRYALAPQPGYPFELALELEYALTDAGLSVRMAATNTGSGPCPFGAGAHPYLAVVPDRPGATGSSQAGPVPPAATIDPLALRIPAATWLRADDRMIPIGRAAVDGTAYDFRASRRIDATVLDTCFTDLVRDADGMARVELASPDGSARTTLWMDGAFDYVMVFSADGIGEVARRRCGLAVEPMTCAPNAFQTGAGLRILAPGETFTGTWGIAP
jgi:aldose 1-epimerase